MTTRHSVKKLIPVERYEDLPVFGSEAEEARFWATHRLGDALLADFERPAPDDPDLPPVRPRKLKDLRRG